MAVYHDEVEIEDFEYDEELETYFYPCPCGDQFQISKVVSYVPGIFSTCSACMCCISTIKLDCLVCNVETVRGWRRRSYLPQLFTDNQSHI